MRYHDYNVTILPVKSILKWLLYGKIAKIKG